MFLRILRQLANKRPAWVLVTWLLVAVVLRIFAPSWDEVALEGDLDHLPADAPSVVAAKLQRQAFPDKSVKSEVVLVFAREDEKLSVEDRQFILDLAFELEKIDDLPLVDVWHAKTELVNRMLLSPADQSEMVVARLDNPIMAVDNIRVRDRVMSLVESRMVSAPAGLQFGLTGSAAIGGDTFAATRRSLRATHVMTVLLVLVCLSVIYRAPILVFIPLLTIGLSVAVSNNVVALLVDLMRDWEHLGRSLKVFTTTRVFIIVILFGAGTDYCLFLISRYREELIRGVAPRRAPGVALRNVANALAGSAFTSILGLGTLAFADYGKFASSGPVIAICLFIAMLASVTLAPALLRAIGPAVFWPHTIESLRRQSEAPDHRLWDAISRAVIRRPGLILVACLALGSPLVMIGSKVPVSHDLLSVLPPESPSLRGAQLVRKHFGEGWMAPMKLIVRKPGANMLEPDARFDVSLLHDALYQLPEVHDVRSPYLPTGGDPSKQRRFSFEGLYSAAAAGSPLSIRSFVSDESGFAGAIMQLSVVLSADPFSQQARDMLANIEQALEQVSHAETLRDEPNPWLGAEFSLTGPTPGMRDLQHVTASDQIRIQMLSVAAVLGVLLLIIRRPVACVYLIATVLFSYWVTMGVTQLFFQFAWGDTYSGLDWKVPIFLFVILVAVGQDYNVYLTTRVLEEQRKHGQRDGLRRAIVHTGGIITSCGIIMAGTFVSLAFGDLRGLIELGFALTLGVLLDTFVVRTVLVPCFFALTAGWGEERGRLTPN